MGIHQNQNGGNDPVANSTVPDAGECARTRILGIQSLGMFDKIRTIYTSIQPHGASGG